MPVWIYNLQSKMLLCDAIYLGNTQQTFKTKMHGPLSDILRLFKKIQNHTHFLPTSNSTLRLLCHICVTWSFYKKRQTIRKKADISVFFFCWHLVLFIYILSHPAYSINLPLSVNQEVWGLPCGGRLRGQVRLCLPSQNEGRVFVRWVLQGGWELALGILPWT